MLNKLVGQTLNRYKIVSQLGSGGMGMVFKAHDISLQRDVAIKIMHTHIASQPNFQERFLQEARTAARLDHPGIVQVYDFGNRPYLYIVMKFIPGDNLATMLRKMREKQKTMILSEAVQIIRLTADALDYVHNNGVLHRDIKPGNIMIEPVATGGLPYRPVITDLGLAKLAGGGVVTADGSSMGTPAYMSPEQALGEETDARSDVYSLGVLLFELATGGLPFPAKTLTEAIHYHTKQPPPPPRSIRPELPQTLEAIILKAMEKNPAARYPNAAALSAALATVQIETSTVVEPAAMTGALSLITEYQNSLVEPRGDSILEEFNTPPNLKGDQVQVLTAGKEVRNVAMKVDGLTIGRDADNDIVLDDPKVSRHHARIDFDGSEYRVLDLDSSNGTFLANNRLLPGISDVWEPDKGLRIGNTWLRLSRAQSNLNNMTGTRLDYSRVMSSPGQGRVGVFLENTNLSVEPGQSLAIQLVLINQGDIVDHFIVSFTGIPKEWAPNLPQPIYLMPGDQQEVKLNLQPPRTPTSRAGRYALTIIVSSKADPDQTAQTKATLTVAPFSQFKAELQPQSLRTGQKARITVANQGNLQETFTVQFSDAGEVLSFQPPQLQLHVPEGGSATAEFQAQLRQVRWVGGEKSHAFSAQVSPPRGEPQSLRANLLSTGLVPAWLPPILLLLCCFTTVLGARYLPPLLFPAPPFTLTPTSTPTLTATVTSSATPEPGAPTVEWCVYPSNQPPASLSDCPIQQRIISGQTVTIEWRVSNAEKVVITPLGDQAPSGTISSYTVPQTTTFTIEATNAAQKKIQKTIQVIVEPPTPTPVTPTLVTPNTPVPTSTSTVVPPTFTPTPTHTLTPVSNSILIVIVYWDVDNDGRYRSNDFLVPAVVELYSGSSCSGPVVATPGVFLGYIFSDLPAGTYCVKVVNNSVDNGGSCPLVPRFGRNTKVYQLDTNERKEDYESDFAAYICQ